MLSNIYLSINNNLTKHRQFILYAGIGLVGVTIDYIAYAIGVKVIGLGLLTANLISVSLGIINNFILNTKYNFKKKDNILLRFCLFFIVGLCGLLISDLLLIAFHYWLNFSPLISKLMTLPFVLIIQYVVNKLVTFGNVYDIKHSLKKLSIFLKT